MIYRTTPAPFSPAVPRRLSRWGRTLSLFTLFTLFVIAEAPPEPIVIQLPIDADCVQAARDLIQQLQYGNQLPGVLAIVHQVPGDPPKVLLRGDPAYAQRAAAMFQELLPSPRPRPLVKITAALQEISDTDLKNIGINLLPNPITISDVQAVFSRGQYPGYSGQVNVADSTILELDEAISHGKILISGEIFTPNGMPAQMTNTNNVPVFTFDNYGNVNTQYQNLETSLQVTPTLLEYVPDQPEKTRVRLTVTIKISFISGEHQMRDVTAPEYSVKTFTATRVVRADEKKNVVGTFSNDSVLRVREGIPILCKIPILKYLFSSLSDERQRNAAFLTIAVKVLPPEEGETNPLPPETQLRDPGETQQAIRPPGKR